MKRADPVHFFNWCIVVLLLAIGVAHQAEAQQQGRQLVSSGAQAEPLGGLPANVIRQRTVSLNLQAPQQAAADPLPYLIVSFFDDAQFQLEIQRSEVNQSGGMTYSGKVVGAPFSPAVIVNNDGVVSIMLSSADLRFSIQGSPVTGYVARELSGADRRDHPPTSLDLRGPQRFQVPGTGAADPFPTEVTAARDDGSSIDVMVVYTQAARAANGGTAQMNANVDAQIALTNTIYSNSNVVQRLRLVYKGEVQYTEVNMDTDLPRVTSGNDGFLDEVPILRDIYKADLVSLWGVYNDYCGLGWLMGTESAAFDAQGYNVVASPACTGAGSYTFAHEMGHNMGLRHDPYMDSGTNTLTPEGSTTATSGVTYAHGYVDLINRFRTVMAYNDQCVATFGSSSPTFGCVRIPYFSNPSVNYLNNPPYTSAVSAPTGNATNNHEQRALNDTRETVANFRQALATLTGPGVITLLESSKSVPEGGGTVTVRVGRHLGSTGAVSVSYSTVNGTATAGSDFVTSAGTLSWADGDSTEKTISVSIIQDAVLEGNETFTIALSTPTGGATLGTVSTAIVKILDDEPDTFPSGGVMPAGYTTPGASAGAWTVDTTDGYLSTASLRSANVLAATQGVYVNSDLSYTGTFAAGNIGYAWRISSYPNFGQFEFLIDNVVVFSNTGGETSWATRSEPITAGTHTITWRFKNRLNFACASAIPAPPGGANCADRVWVDAITLPLPLVSTTTSLSSSLNPSTLGQSVTFTAGVTAASGAVTGSINFADGGTSIAGCGAVAIVSGSAQCTTSSLAQGARSITATYSGSGTHSSSVSSALQQVVNSAAGATPKRGDLNGDGKGDIVWRNGSTGANWYWAMNGTTITAQGPITTLPTDWAIQSTAVDFDGDGKADILLRNMTTGQPWIWFMNANTILGGGPLPTLSDMNWTIAGTGDLNGDGKGDVIWRNTATGQNWWWAMNGTTLIAQGPITALPTDWAIQATIGDFNGDGKTDILWRNTTTGQPWVWMMDSNNIIANGPLPTLSDLNWTIAGTGDLNGDGKADVVWRNVSTGANWYWAMNGTTITAQGPITTLPTDWQFQATHVDFDGDGKSDILLRNMTTGQPWIWFMNGNTITGGGPLPTLSDFNWQIRIKK